MSLNDIFPIFHKRENTNYLYYMLNVTFIFDKCRHSTAVVPSVKYECHL